MQYHPVVSKITRLLADAGMWYETFEHEPVRTSEEAASVRTGYALAQGAKAIIVRIKVRGVGKKFAMIVVPGDRRFSKSKLERLYDISDVRFATENEVSEITGGVLPGGVPPFGTLFNLEVFADEKIFANERIIFNAGDRSFSVGMKSVDYKTMVSPLVADITE